MFPVKFFCVVVLSYFSEEVDKSTHKEELMFLFVFDDAEEASDEVDETHALVLKLREGVFEL